MVNRKTTMKVGEYKTRKQALSAASNFRKGSSKDISMRYSVTYRVEKSKSNKDNFCVISTLKPKKINVQKQKEKGRKRFEKRKFTTGDERVKIARKKGKAPSQRKYRY